MKTLIVYLKPKDELYEVEDQLNLIPCDKLVLSYFPYPQVYQEALKQIKKLTDYEFIVWVQNDIVLTCTGFEQLRRGLESTQAAILGAVMNVDLSPKGLELLAYTVDNFIIEKNQIGFLPKDPPYVERGRFQGLTKVFHNGGVFICKREFYIKSPSTGMGTGGYNADLKHGSEIRKAGLNYWVDNNIILKHLRYSGKMQVHKKPPKVELIKYDN